MQLSACTQGSSAAGKTTTTLMWAEGQSAISMKNKRGGQPSNVSESDVSQAGVRRSGEAATNACSHAHAHKGAVEMARCQSSQVGETSVSLCMAA